jgi:hypothetical protein
MAKEEECHITVRFPRELVRRCKVFATEQERSFNGQVVMAVKEWVDRIEREGVHAGVAAPDTAPPARYSIEDKAAMVRATETSLRDQAAMLLARQFRQMAQELSAEVPPTAAVPDGPPTAPARSS